MSIAVIDFGNTGRNVWRRGVDGGSFAYLPPELLVADAIMTGEQVGGAAARLSSSVGRLPDLAVFTHGPSA